MDYHGSITACNIGGTADEYVDQEAIPGKVKVMLYDSMGMLHFTRDMEETRRVCMHKL